MGQRTQIALVIEDKEHSKRIIRVYHDQWGIGRRMFLDIMNLANCYYFCGNEFRENRADAFHLGEQDGVFELWNWTYSFKTRKKFQEDVAQILTPSGAYDKIFSRCDNNNGGLVVHIVLNKWSEKENNIFEYGFLLGFEDADNDQENRKAFARWLGAEEFAALEVNSHFADDKFMKIFRDFADYFGLKEIKND